MTPGRFYTGFLKTLTEFGGFWYSNGKHVLCGEYEDTTSHYNRMESATMAELKYKTRNQADPSRKPRVYIACHPQDHSLFLEDVCRRILRISDCAIYYYDPTDDIATDENYFFNLEQMQLFVMPVTRRLLESDCRAMDLEYTYAVKNKKPVLPLMYESGLEQLFNAKCGDLQYLEPNGSDATAIPFKEKLKRYLQTVLLSDQLQQLLHQAFDASIFLSYRKKDRKYAQELMRLIHAEPMCRDVAIWYDEFLVPGENFNHAIENALLDSYLFALVVTPNLLEPNNYVMTTEYIKASEKQKRILAATMVDTDGEALAACYHNIPMPVDGYDSTALSRQLQQKLSGVALMQNDGDPTHDYLIGLAYLYGVDVEVDPERAVSLIRISAEAGLPQAMQKMAEMYHSGVGVERDYRQEVFWLEQMVRTAEDAYQKAGTIESVHTLLECLNAVRWAWYSLKNTDKVLKTCLEMIATAKRWLYEEKDPTAGYAIFRAILGMGDTYFEAGEMDRAEECYTDALKLAKASEQIRDCLSPRDVPIIFERLAAVAKAEQDFSRASALYAKALEQREMILQQENTLESQRDIALNYDALGAMAMKQGKIETALEYYTKALEIKKAQADAVDTENTGLDLCVSYYNIGIACMSLMRRQEAVSNLLLALEVAEKSDNGERTVQEQLVLSEIYAGLADLHLFNEDLETALSYADRGTVVLEKLAAYTDLPEISEKHAGNLLVLADIHSKDGDFETADKCCRKAFSIANKLRHQTGLPAADILLIKAITRIGSVREAQQDFSGAQQAYMDALNASEMLELKDSGLQRRSLMIESYLDLRRICEKLEDLDAAVEYVRKAIELSEQECTETESDASGLLLASLYKEYAQLCAEAEDIPAAVEGYEKACAICESLIERSALIEAEMIRVTCYGDWGRVLYQMGDLETAIVQSMQCVHLGEELAEFFVGPAKADLMGILSGCYHRMAKMLQSEGALPLAKKCYASAFDAYVESITDENMEDVVLAAHDCAVACARLCEEDEELLQAREFYLQAIKTLSVLVGNTQRDDVLHVLSSDYHSAGEISVELEQLEEALSYFAVALALDTKMSNQMPTRRNLQNLSAIHIKMGDIYCDLENEAEAEKYYADALDIDRAIARQIPDLYALGALASTCLRMGDLKKDRRLLEEAIDLCDRMIEMNPNDPRFLQMRMQIEDSLSGL